MSEARRRRADTVRGRLGARTPLPFPRAVVHQTISLFDKGMKARLGRRVCGSSPIFAPPPSRRPRQKAKPPEAGSQQTCSARLRVHPRSFARRSRVQCSLEFPHHPRAKTLELVGVRARARHDRPVPPVVEELSPSARASPFGRFARKPRVSLHDKKDNKGHPESPERLDVGTQPLRALKSSTRGTFRSVVTKFKF